MYYSCSCGYSWFGINLRDRVYMSGRLISSYEFHDLFRIKPQKITQRNNRPPVAHEHNIPLFLVEITKVGYQPFKARVGFSVDGSASTVMS
jgi:hypothetical protein